MLSNTPSRSAFLQSLQRSRERNSATSATSATSVSGESSQTPIQPKSTSSFTPRRLSLSPLRAAAAAELKPAVNTPSMQSKLASHAYTLSRSSEDEMRSSRDGLFYGQESEFEALKREIEQDKRRESFYSSASGSGGSASKPVLERTTTKDKYYKESGSIERESKEKSSIERNSKERSSIDNRNSIVIHSIDNRNSIGTTPSRPVHSFLETATTPFPSEPSFSVLESSRRAPLPSEVDLNEDRRLRPSQRYQALNVLLPEAKDQDAARLQQLIQTEVSASLSALRNDLQNLHVEMIKQSLAQQATMRSLFETYLPMTGKLMDALSEAREENEKLKLFLLRK